MSAPAQLPTPPFDLLRLDHIVLRTENAAALLAFYCGLGCQPVRFVEELGLHQIQAGASMLDIVDVAGPLGRAKGGAPDPQARNVDHFALRIEPFDPDALKAYFDGIGAKCTLLPMPLLGAEGFGPSVYVEDPDGNTVELKGPADSPGVPA